MNADQLVLLGNEYRSNDQYTEALKCYAQAFVTDYNNIHAWNNYGNVLREIGEPLRAVPFLQHAIAIDPDFVTAHFNLSIANLLSGNYKEGWDQYEWRWKYEHLNGLLPELPVPQWTGQSLIDKTILVCGEQGFGDTIQFFRFIFNLEKLGAKVILLCLPGLVPLFQNLSNATVVSNFEAVEEYDFWIPMMSIPRVINVTLENLQHYQYYIKPNFASLEEWKKRLGSKRRMRVGITWSGRSDNWVNRYKQLPIEYVKQLILNHPNVEWIGLQAEIPDEVQTQIKDLPIRNFPGTVHHWGDTAGLVGNLDIVVSVDTSVAHLSGSLGIPTYIPLTKFAVDWRWGLTSDRSPWYPSARLFRQPNFGDWQSVIGALSKFIHCFKL